MPLVSWWLACVFVGAQWGADCAIRKIKKVVRRRPAGAEACLDSLVACELASTVHATDGERRTEAIRMVPAGLHDSEAPWPLDFGQDPAV